MCDNTELQQLRQPLPILRKKLPPDLFDTVLDDLRARYSSRLREAIRCRYPLTRDDAHPASHCPAGGGFPRASRKAGVRSPTPGQTDKNDLPPHTAPEALMAGVFRILYEANEELLHLVAKKRICVRPSGRSKVGKAFSVTSRRSFAAVACTDYGDIQPKRADGSL